LTLLSDLNEGLLTFQGSGVRDQSTDAHILLEVPTTSYLPPLPISCPGWRDRGDYAISTGTACPTSYKFHIFFSFIVKSPSNSLRPFG
jgi:hypothetical protein